MKPILSAWPAKKRTAWFAPFLGIILLVSFLVVAFATQNFFLAVLIPPVLAVGGAYALVGWPQLQRKDGKPYVEPQHRPYLFFVLVPLFSLVLYPILGVATNEAGIVATNLVTLGIILLSIALAVTAAYFLVGVPNVYGALRRRYEATPPDRRPFLFFPLFAAFFLVLLLALGVLTTQLLDELAPEGPEALLNIQLLVVLPIAAILAGVLAWLLVGIPKPTKRAGEYLPKVPGKHRRRVFLGTFLLAGIPLVAIIGAILTYATPLPSTVILALAVLLGFATSLGLAALVWGTPTHWRTFEDYEPGLDPRVRTPLFVGIAFLVGLLVIVGFGLADVDLFWGILAGLIVGAIVLLFLTGTHRRVAARRGQGTLVPDLPDAMKPLILFPTWIGITIVLFAVMAYALPGLVGVSLLIALVVGLAVAFLLLEAPLLKDLVEERRRERQKRKEWEARRRERLAEAEQGKQPEA